MNNRHTSSQINRDAGLDNRYVVLTPYIPNDRVVIVNRDFIPAPPTNLQPPSLRLANNHPAYPPAASVFYQQAPPVNYVRVVERPLPPSHFPFTAPMENHQMMRQVHPSTVSLGSNSETYSRAPFMRMPARSVVVPRHTVMTYPRIPESGISLPNIAPQARSQTETFVEQQSRTKPSFSRRYAGNASKWNLKYQELRAFKEDHGHCLVPTRFKRNPSLAFWVMHQRAYYRALLRGEQTYLTEERIGLLNSIGFVWEVRSSSKKQGSRRK